MQLITRTGRKGPAFEQKAGPFLFDFSPRYAMLMSEQKQRGAGQTNTPVLIQFPAEKTAFDRLYPTAPALWPAGIDDLIFAGLEPCLSSK